MDKEEEKHIRLQALKTCVDFLDQHTDENGDVEPKRMEDLFHMIRGLHAPIVVYPTDSDEDETKKIFVVALDETLVGTPIDECCELSPEDGFNSLPEALMWINKNISPFAYVRRSKGKTEAVQHHGHALVYR